MSRSARVLVFWLEESLDEELRSVLGAESEMLDSEAPASEDECLELIEGRCPDVVFCPSDPVYYQTLLKTLKQSHRHLPVIVVSRHPEVTAWIDAMEAGVADYCSAPFETAHMRWILQCSRAAGKFSVA